MADIDAQFAVFRRLVNEQLRFLEDEFGFRETEAKRFFPGMWIHWRNATTDVGVQFEYDGGLWVTIAQIDVDGNLVSEHALWRLLMVRAPDLPVPRAPKYFQEEEITAALQEQAALLKQYASDVLRGDFTVFPVLKEIRDAELAKRQTLPRLS